MDDCCINSLSTKELEKRDNMRERERLVADGRRLSLVFHQDKSHAHHFGSEPNNRVLVCLLMRSTAGFAFPPSFTQLFFYILCKLLFF